MSVSKTEESTQLGKADLRAADRECREDVQQMSWATVAHGFAQKGRDGASFTKTLALTNFTISYSLV